MKKVLPVLVLGLVLLSLAGIAMPAGDAGGNSAPQLREGCVWILVPLGTQDGKDYYAPLIECPAEKQARK